ncbi:MAG: lytic murein transglycosylase [Desulfovibrio sp.]|jgi:membrane-bound lytic murein transglycosylase B|nr:lytic murein transglycosylase [Desulfovibrio sp.]
MRAITLISCFTLLLCGLAAHTPPCAGAENIKAAASATQGKKTAAPGKSAQTKPAKNKTAKKTPAKASPTKASPAKAAKPAAKAQTNAPPKETAASRVSASLGSPQHLNLEAETSEGWKPLAQKLQADPTAAPELAVWFRGLPDYSPQPMGEKIKELFTRDFMRRPRVEDGKKLPPSRIYRNVVTEVNVQKCREFLAANARAFEAVEAKYPVPSNVLVSLLFVETRLGVFVGKENAFWSLACMAAADTPEKVRDALAGLPIDARHEEWLQTRLKSKSDWAYAELRALLLFCRDNGIDPRVLPGSVYGAIGICQFMPSNLARYGEDGDNDGRVNLFSEADAIFSAARYLSKNGWKKGIGVESQRKALKHYNNLNIYANTILAMAESIRSGVLQTGPPPGKRKR